MKRTILTALGALAAAAAFAAPANAQDLHLDEVAISVAPCKYWETYSQCAQRIAHETVDKADPDYLIDTAFYYVNEAGRIVGQTIDRVDDLCGDVFPTCAAVAP